MKAATVPVLFSTKKNIIMANPRLCFGGKKYATTTAAAAGKLAAESKSPGPAPSPGLGGATTTMLSAGFGLLASAVAVMLM